MWNSKEERAPQGGALAEAAIAAATLAAIAWLAYFLLAPRLGLFQDDVWMYYIVRLDEGGLLEKAFDLGRQYGGEGRPLTQPAIVLCTYVGAQLGGVNGLYVLNCILLTVHVVLGYACLRHFFPARTSLLAAAFLALFPADAAKFFFVSSIAWVGTSLYWSALLLLLRRRVVLSAVVLSATFLLGEAFILPGALLPLLLIADNREEVDTSVRRAVRFWAVYGAIMVPAVVLRLIYAPGRAAQGLHDFDRWMMVKRVAGSVVFGMAASAWAMVSRVVEPLAHGDLFAWSVAAMAAAILLFALSRVSPERAHATAAADAPVAAARLRIRWMVAFAVLAWAASYPLYGMYPERFPPLILEGKLSNVHEQAALGAVWLAALAFGALEKLDARRLRGAVAAAYLGTLAGSFAMVQERYVQEWHHELSFWRWLPVAVNLKPDSLVVVDAVGDEAKRLDGSSPFDWTLPHLFRFMWRPPVEWDRQPLIIPRPYYNRYATVLPDRRVNVRGYTTVADRVFAPADVTYVRAETDRFAVLDGPSGRPVAGRAPSAYPLFDESLPRHPPMAPGELELRATGTPYYTIVANDFTSAAFRHGIALARGPRASTFYFLADDEAHIPVRVGDSVEFPHAGRGTVRHIKVEKHGARFGVFVTVDRLLEPDLDGFPHEIHVRP